MPNSDAKRLNEAVCACATYSINWLVFITEMKSVYSAVRTRSLNKRSALRLLKVKGHFTLTETPIYVPRRKMYHRSELLTYTACYVTCRTVILALVWVQTSARQQSDVVCTGDLFQATAERKELQTGWVAEQLKYDGVPLWANSVYIYRTDKCLIHDLIFFFIS
jgi:hypothetical protein